MELGDVGRRRVHDYSKGMRQRIGLAQALLGEPELVFLDEPTSVLDPFGRRLVRDVIRDLRARGTAVFLNSHLLSEVEVTCDRVAFVKDGRGVRVTILAETEPDLEGELRLEGGSAALFAVGVHFIALDVRAKVPLRQQPMVLSFVVMAALYASNFLIVMTSVLVAVDTLAGEIGSGVVETLCNKPVSRAAIALGKWLGCWLLLVVYASVLCGGVLLVARLLVGYTPPHAAPGVPPLPPEGGGPPAPAPPRGP